MKYGLLTHIGFSKQGENNNRIVSMGDVFECLAISRIYEELGISKQDLIICYPYELDTYMGEYVVLPINVYALNVNYSRRILPVFLGLTLGGEHMLSQQNINILRRFSPVGCRDERTMRTLTDLGIDAYVQGCLVATFDERIQNLPTQNKVFFVDSNAAIQKFIPLEILNNYEFVSHDYYVNLDNIFNGEDMFQFGRNMIERYKKEAKLIITSKYHAALIALALGIPVIFVIENNYYKYSWVEKYIPIYEPKDFKNINWNPQTVVIPKEEKLLMLQIAKQKIMSTYDKYKDICMLSEIRERPEIEEFEDIFYGTYAIEYIKENWKKDIKIEYGFWGATDTSIKLNKYIFDNYPNAKLKVVYDWSVRNPIIYAEGEFIPISLENLETEESKNLFVFVTGNSASQAAKELFKKIGKENYFLCERKVLSEEDIINGQT